jgi:hypothetical protein
MQRNDDHKWFDRRVAAFNAAGFALATGSVTFVDARLTSHVLFDRAREYPLGYWICGASVPILVGTLWGINRVRHWKWKIALPPLVLLVVGLCSLANFAPEVPHMGVLLWLLGYCLVSLLAGLLHYLPESPDWLQTQRIRWQLRVERAKESATLWRTVAISTTFGYVALLIPWTNSIWKLAPQIATKKDEVFLLSATNAMGIAFCSIYVLCAVVFVAFARARRTADLILKISDEAV